MLLKLRPSNHLCELVYLNLSPYKLTGVIQCYTEQQLYDMHLQLESSDFDSNSYENKLHVFKSARRNQLQAEILSVNILSDV